jgi:hypothetical protein
MRDNLQKVHAMQDHVAEQMARASDELQAQKKRAADLVKAQVKLLD